MKHRLIKRVGQEEMSDDFFREIWFGNEYDQYGICVEDGDVVLDCGSNIGLFTDYALFKGASKVFGFEADQITHEVYGQNFPSTTYTNVQNKMGTVGCCDGCIDLRDIFEISNVKTFDFAKIDIEGSEFDLILKSPDTLLKQINKWAIEIHLLGYWQNSGTEMKLLLQMIEKFNRSGFNTYLRHIHTDLNLMMLYAKKQ